jgi:hypothetical protein
MGKNYSHILLWLRTTEGAILNQLDTRQLRSATLVISISKLNKYFINATLFITSRRFRYVKLLPVLLR